jgi:hypothetical protein
LISSTTSFGERISMTSVGTPSIRVVSSGSRAARLAAT